MKNTSKRVAFLGCVTALALVLAYLEILLPPIVNSIPGIKLGLPNIAIIFVLYRFGLRDAAIVSFMRILVVSLLFGNPMTFAYSVAGAVLSLVVMTLLRKLNFLSTVGVSVAGGVFHNVGQILTAMVLLGTAELGYYLIVLAVTGTVAGILIGLCAGVAIKRVPNLKM
ncbi:MAG: Gx transporter family protein [Ruminococcaceae bacterium]|nr:Gx transporter family protein [Oscillospiraceae bacterium]